MIGGSGHLSNGWSSQAKASANRRRSRVHLGQYSVHRGKNRRRKPDRVVEYGQYMDSDDWTAKRRLFFADTTLPKVCMGCGSDTVELHHLTYERLGFELLTDLAPLCHTCHLKLHKMDPLAGRKGGLLAFRKSLIYDFGIGTIEVDAMLAPYRPAWRRRGR